MDSISPIHRRSLHGELVARLRDMIVEGRLAPGEKVNEKALSEVFDVSRTPLREALKVLASEGFVRQTPNRGSTVADLTEQDIDELFPVMGVLEGLAGELACERISDVELQSVRDLHAEMVAHFQAGDLQNYFRCNQAIHETILEASRNPTLIGIYRSLAGRVRRARYLANHSASRWHKAVQEHEEILAALEAKDGPRLSGILRNHLLSKLEAVRTLLKGEAPRP
jgi:DNA-binding GntR family transcriptional regulator